MKKEKSQYAMTDYEKQRLNKLKQNACRMEAAGFGTLANKILVSKYETTTKKTGAGQVVLEDNDSEDMSNGDRDYYPNQEEDREEDDLVPNATHVMTSRNENILMKNGGRQSLQQTIPMVEFAKERKRKRLAQQQQLHVHQKQPQVHSGQHESYSEQRFAPKKKPSVQQSHENQQNLPSQVSSQPQAPRHQLRNPQLLPSQVSSKPQAPRQQLQNPQHIVASKNMVQQKKVLRNQVCSPGSLDVYKRMRQRQLERNVGHHPSIELSPTTMVEDEVAEGLFNLNPHDHVVQRSPIRSTSAHDVPQFEANSSPGVLVDNQNEMEIDCHVDSHDDTKIATKKKKHRGPTLMAKVHRRKLEERQVIIFNENIEPVEPAKAVVEFSNFLGTLARDPELSPERYIIPEEAKDYVLKSVNGIWVVYKSRLKKNHYTAYSTYEERWANRPATIPNYQFKDLLDYWDSPESKEIASKNKANRQKHEDVHTLGPVSIARLRHELTQNHANKEPPLESTVYKHSRIRDSARVYKTNGCKAKENIEKINKVQ